MQIRSSQPPLVTEPVYQQLHSALKRMIQEGALQPGERFLTERQVSEQFGVSRVTANKALSSLVAEGRLEFKKGVGTFVRAAPLDYDLRTLVSFTDKARAAGKIPSTRLLHFETLPVSEDDAERLHLNPGEPVYAIERLRLADDLPVILERRRIVARHCPDLTETHLLGSLYSAFTERFGLEITGAEETIRAVAITGPDAAHLQVPDGAAGLLVLAVGRMSGDRPLWVEETLYRGDAYEFRNAIGPLSPQRPASGALITPKEPAP